MKKKLLFLAGLLSSGVAAQAQWATQPITFANPTSEYPVYVDGVDANVAWAAVYDFENAGSNQFARTFNGSVWTTGTIANLAEGEQIMGIAGLSGSTALVAVLNAGPLGGGRILKTTNAGSSWTQQTTATQFSEYYSYPGLITFFNATDGVCVGDPYEEEGKFEIYTTSDAGTTWIRVPDANIPDVPTGEWTGYNILGGQLKPAVVGNSIWFLSSEGRVFYSSNKGENWSVGTANVGAFPTSIAFQDASTGLAIGWDATLGRNHILSRTTDGGATWQPTSYTGPLHGYQMANAPGTSNYISLGLNISNSTTNISNNDQGSSYSRDNGQTWVALESTRNFISVDAVSPTVVWAGGINSANGAAAVYKLTSTVLNTTKDVALQRGLSVYPNPSTSGQFNIKLASGRGGEAQVLVVDAMGRSVYQRTVRTTASPEFSLDLGRQTAGIYTLQIRTEGGTAQQKIVVE